MADGEDQRGRPRRELVFCHSCENEWYRDEHGLVCPECTSDIVEIIEPDSDPRDAVGVHDHDHDHDLQHQHRHGLLHDHDPWGTAVDAPDPWGTIVDAPDPDEGDIAHVEWTRPEYPSSSDQDPRPGSDLPEPFDGLFGAIFGGAGRGQPDGPTGPGFLPFPPPPGGVRTTHMQIGPFSFMASTTRRDPQGADDADFHGILGSIFGNIPVRPGGGPGGAFVVRGGGLGPREEGGAPPHPFHLLAHIFDPANARAGDAVFTQEAMDRLMTQFMEQNSASTAPGPASRSAIEALPRIAVGKEQLDERGRAECSICMDAADAGAEVAELPCKHWFHFGCIAAWLQEHDTCPQCRRGIMARDGDGTAPRETGQQPRNWQLPVLSRQSSRDSPAAAGSRHDPVIISSEPPSPERRRSGNGTGPEGGGGNGGAMGGAAGLVSGIAGWMGRHIGGGSGSGSGGGGAGGGDGSH